MYRIIFQYRWAAILFVLLTMGTAVQLVGTSEEDGKLAEAQQKVIAKRQQLVATTAADNADETVTDEEEVEPDEGFSDDSDLVQEAEGLDPTPAEDDQQEDQTVKLVDSSETEPS